MIATFKGECFINENIPGEAQADLGVVVCSVVSHLINNCSYTTEDALDEAAWICVEAISHSMERNGKSDDEIEAEEQKDEG